MTLSMTSAMTNRQDISEYIAALQKIDMTAKDSGYSEIVKASQWCQANLTLFTENPSEEIDAFIESGDCWSWLELVSAFLADPEEESYESALNDELLRDEWLQRYEEDDVLELILQLATSSDFASDVRSPYSLSLSFTWDEGTHPELIEALFEEATELVSQLSNALQQISKKELNGEGRYHASRLAHTLKGGSATTGITALSSFSYRLEKILEYSVNHELADEIYSLLAESSSCLVDLFQAVKEKTGEPQSFAAVFTHLSDYAETLEEDVEPLTLGKPNLPDFITQQTPSEPTSESSTD